MNRLQIAEYRHSVIEDFCHLEDVINLCIHQYYQSAALKEFIEDVFMSGVNGFSLKLDLLTRIIQYNQNIQKEFFENKKEQERFQQEIRQVGKIRNYFAHTPLGVTGDGLHRSKKQLDFTVDLIKEYENFGSIMSKILPIVGGIHTRLAEQKSIQE